MSSTMKKSVEDKVFLNFRLWLAVSGYDFDMLEHD